MRTRRCCAALALALGWLVAGCGGERNTPAPFPPTTVEATASIAPPQGTATTAPDVLPRVPDVPLEAARAPLFRLERLSEVWDEPVYATFEGETLYVVERAGRILTLEDGEGVREPFLDIRRRVRTEIEEGLHSLAFHPAFAENGRLFVAYNDKRGDVRIVEYHADGQAAEPASAREVFAVDKTEGVKWHNGGQLQFGPDGHLYFAMGDSARNPYDELPDPPSTPDPTNNSQNAELVFGKLVRFAVDDRSPRPQVVAVGLRNTWRFSFDRENGDLYLADVGQFAWDELDYVPAGTSTLLNFGWSVFEANAFHNRTFELSFGRLTWPILRVRHGPGLYCSERGSIIGGYVYRGNEIPELVGRYVFGDYCSGELWTTRVVRGRATEVRKEPLEVPGLVSFAEGADGELYAISLLGSIFRIARPS